jgi:GT2 family glycosyltransferase
MPSGSVPDAAVSHGARPRVAGIVLSYNGKEVTLLTLGSLLESRYPALDLVLVDNGSTDGTAEAVAETFPQVRVLRIATNRGPVPGMNLGLRFALDQGYDYPLLLNNDIEVDPAMVDELVAAIESDPEVGCVGPKAYYYEDRNRLWSTGGIVRFKESVNRERGMGDLDGGQYDRDGVVDYLTGCALLMRREALEATGYFDPIFSLSVEDADWGVRMRRAGFRAVYAHRAVLWHMVSATTGTYTPAKNYQTGRSSAIFVRRYATPWQWLTFAAYTAAALPLAWLRELRRGNQSAATAKLRGILAGLRAELAQPPTLTDESAVGTQEAGSGRQ